MSRNLDWNRAASSRANLPAVAEAMLEGLAAPPRNRGGGDIMAQRILAIRSLAARLHGFAASNRVSFQSSCTEALNLALSGCLEPGDIVVTSRLEHNAVLRPLDRLRRARAIQIREVGFDDKGFLRLEELEQKLQGAQWLVLTAASNVLGTIQPLPKACTLAHASGTRILLDLAQASGQLPLALDDWGVSVAATGGHKGLYGPTGIGLLFCAQDCTPAPLLAGGTGTHGATLSMPTETPGCWEAGTANLPGILGLGAALEHFHLGLPNLAPVRSQLAQFESHLRQRNDVQVLPQEQTDWNKRLPILSLLPYNASPDLLEMDLAQRGLLVRGGLQCAAHACVDLGAPQGVLRISPPAEASAEDFLWARETLDRSLDSFT